MRQKIGHRSVFTAIAFSATVGATIAAASLGGNPQLGNGDLCEAFAWPNVPAHCLEGTADAKDVRLIPILSNAERDLRMRFDTAFGPRSEG